MINSSLSSIFNDPVILQIRDQPPVPAEHRIRVVEEEQEPANCLAGLRSCNLLALLHF